MTGIYVDPNKVTTNEEWKRLCHVGNCAFGGYIADETTGEILVDGIISRKDRTKTEDDLYKKFKAGFDAFYADTEEPRFYE